MSATETRPNCRKLFHALQSYPYEARKFRHSEYMVAIRAAEKMIQKEMSAGWNPNDIFVHQYTFLTFLLDMLHLPLAEKIVEMGVDPNHPDGTGCFPLDYAAHRISTDTKAYNTVEKLRKHGATRVSPEWYAKLPKRIRESLSLHNSV